MEMTAKRWADLLSTAHSPGREATIYTTPFRRTLRIRSEAWEQGFGGFDGLELRPGKEVELIAGDEGGARVSLPDWAVEHLSLESGDDLCITRRNGRLYLKRLNLVEAGAPVPGCTIVDTFGERAVTRTYTNHPDLDDIHLPGLRRWLSLMGSFHSDPLTAFQAMEGLLSLLARRAFLGGWTQPDRQTAQALAQPIVAAQGADGSWQGDVLLTAAHLIRLRQLETPPDHTSCVNAARWLLALPEPAGLPGLWLVSQALTERFNAWKSRPGAKGRPHRRESRGELTRFVDSVGYTISYAIDACELRLTWTSALVLEALLRCGLHEAPRVLRALNTLLALSNDGGWCGCGYLDARVDVPASTSAIGFDRVPVPQANRPHAIDWFPRREDILRPTYDGHYQALQVGERQAVLAKSWHNTGLCTAVMHRALSYHPRYAGSALEAQGALRLAYIQSATGTWGDMVYLSSMMGFLSRSTHPLAAFLVLRSVPLLIRTQRPDGLWHEAQLPHLDQTTPPPSSAESTFMILSALQRFGFLDPLLPSPAGIG